MNKLEKCWDGPYVEDRSACCIEANLEDQKKESAKLHVKFKGEQQRRC